MTPGIRELISQGLNIAPLLRRHADGDWGDLSKGDLASNDSALEFDDDRLLSSYDTDMSPDGKVWILTDADRSVTTVLLPSED
jgi:hypothetical protein